MAAWKTQPVKHSPGGVIHIECILPESIRGRRIKIRSDVKKISIPQKVTSLIKASKLTVFPPLIFRWKTILIYLKSILRKCA